MGTSPIGTICSGSFRDSVSPSSFAFSSGEKNNDMFVKKRWVVRTRTSDGIVGVERFRVDQIVSKVDHDGEYPYQEDIHGHRVGPIAIRVIENAERMPH